MPSNKSCACLVPETRKCFRCEQIPTKGNMPIDVAIRKCPIHKPKNRQIMICGHPPFICNECEKKGWVGIGGHGGASHAHNPTTLEEDVYAKDVYSYEESDNSNKELDNSNKELDNSNKELDNSNKELDNSYEESDDESHHCKQCNTFDWDGKGGYCSICNSFLCCGCWQCGDYIGCWYEEDIACKDCFKELSDEDKFCDEESCDCDNKSPEETEQRDKKRKLSIILKFGKYRGKWLCELGDEDYIKWLASCSPVENIEESGYANWVMKII